MLKYSIYTPILLILISAKALAFDYNLSRFSEVNRALSEVQEGRIYNFIKDFSSYRTRYHTAPEGIKAAKDLYSYWCNLVAHRNDVSCELIKHNSTPQSSVAIHIKGSTNKHIVLGGHLDSINDEDPEANLPAPGAGDNASGIGVLNEIIKVLMLTNYNSKNNITFYAYAAEEVGLIGSEEIASATEAKKKDILGVLQIDGANYKAGNKSIVLITDYTSYVQNRFIGMLIDQYVKVPWGFDRCGYACSDHYSWHRQGYKVSFPFETKLNYSNPYNHTENDTLGVSGYSAQHATLFAKLGLSYILELDK